MLYHIKELKDHIKNIEEARKYINYLKDSDNNSLLDESEELLTKTRLKLGELILKYY